MVVTSITTLYSSVNMGLLFCCSFWGKGLSKPRQEKLVLSITLWHQKRVLSINLCCNLAEVLPQGDGRGEIPSPQTDYQRLINSTSLLWQVLIPIITWALSLWSIERCWIDDLNQTTPILFRTKLAVSTMNHTLHIQTLKSWNIHFLI